MTSTYMKNRPKITSIKVLILFLFSAIISLWPLNAFATTPYQAIWSPPQWESTIVYSSNVNYIDISSNDCVNGVWYPWTRVGNELSTGSIGGHLCHLGLRSTGGNYDTFGGAGTIARVNVSVSSFAGSLNANDIYLGGINTVGLTNSERHFFPVGIENVQYATVYTNENTIEYVTSFDLLFVQSNETKTGKVNLWMNLYLGSTALRASYFRVGMAVFYADTNAYLQDIKDALTNQSTILENIKNNSNAGVVEQIEETNDKIDETNEKIDDARNEAEQAQQKAQTDGNSSQQQADSSGQTLLGALTSFIGAITNASPGNCSLTLNTGYGFNLGDVNLCSISPPASFQVISSIVVIGFAVPLSISASKKMIELFRGFTG